MHSVFGKQSISAVALIRRTAGYQPGQCCSGLPGIWHGIFQRPIEAINQSFITERLLRETRGSGPRRISASVFRRQSAHENDWPTITIGDKSVLKIYSCHPGHLNVGYDAFRITIVVSAKIFLGGSKGNGFIAQRSNEAFDSFSN